MTRNRYGIPAHTIRYWQHMSRELWRYNGIVRDISQFDARNLSLAASRNVGHAAICVATVLSPAQLKSLLTE